jgi:hypothetical protein
VLAALWLEVSRHVDLNRSHATPVLFGLEDEFNLGAQTNGFRIKIERSS